MKIYKKTLTKKCSPNWSYQKIRLIIYYNKFKTSNPPIISDNSSPFTELLDATNVVYIFKYPLGVCVSKENNTHVGLTTTTLSRRPTMHLNDSSSYILKPILFSNLNCERF